MTSKLSVSILLPTSLVADASELRQKTVKIGSIGRALAIFGVDKVCIYNDDDSNTKNQAIEAKLIISLLNYMETPQYLRKLLFPHTNELRYAGLLPPLRTPHHPLRNEKNKPGDYREGVVIETNKNQSLLEIGLPEKAVVGEKFKVGWRLTIKLGKKSGNVIPVTPAVRAEVPLYWGYEIMQAGGLAEGLKVLKTDYSVGTSRLGQNLYEAVQAIKSSKSHSVAVTFGGPYAGLFEICERQGVDADELFDAIINTIPDQGTATVRTEEALVATLALLNMLIEG